MNRLDPTKNPIHRLRIAVGDIEEDDYLLEDGVYQYFLDVSATEGEATLKALDALIARCARLVDETTDEVSAKWSQLYTHYTDLKKTLQNNPSVVGVRGKIIITGSKSDMVETENPNFSRLSRR